MEEVYLAPAGASRPWAPLVLMEIQVAQDSAAAAWAVVAARSSTVDIADNHPCLG